MGYDVARRTTCYRSRDQLPRLLRALRDGAINVDQAAVIARRVPASRQAEVMRPRSLRRWASLCPPLETDDDKTPPRRPHAFSLRPATDGSDADWLVNGRLPGEVGAAFDTALKSQLDRLWHDHRPAQRAAPGRGGTSRGEGSGRVG